MSDSKQIFPDLAHLHIVHLGLSHGQFLYLSTLQLHHFVMLLDLLLVVDGHHSPNLDLSLEARLGRHHVFLAHHHFVISVKCYELIDAHLRVQCLIFSPK